MIRAKFWKSLAFVSSFALQAQCLSVVRGSPCFEICNGDVATSSGDIVCTDSDYANTEKGKLLQQCVTCLESSSFKNGWMSDPAFFVYYLSAVQQSCLSGKPGQPISNCSNRCGSITSSFPDISGMDFFQSPFSYCTVGSDGYETSAESCSTCLQSQVDTVILGKLVQAGKVGCDQRPDVRNGATIQIDFDLFNSKITDKGFSASSSSTSSVASTTLISSTQNDTNNTAATSTAVIFPTTISASTTGKASTSDISSSSSNVTGKSETDGNGGLSRGAAAGVGIIAGILGVSMIVYLAFLARKRLVSKEERSAGPWEKIRRSSELQQAHDASHRSIPAAAESALLSLAPHPKKSKSVKSYKSWKTTSRRNSAWLAANPKKSADLSALPQRVWD